MIDPLSRQPHCAANAIEAERVGERVQKAKSALAEVEALTHIGSWNFDLKSRRLTWSDETYRIFGLDPETFVPSYEAFFERLHPDDRGRVKEVYQKSVANRTSFDVEHRVLMNDGSVRTVRERGQTFYNDCGIPLHSVGTAQDVTEQREAEAALQASEEKYRSLVETSPDYIFEVDAGMRFTYANPATQNLLGYTAEELACKSPFDFMCDQANVRELTQLVLKRLPISHVETTVRTRDGRKAIVETSATPIFGPDGSFQGYRSIERDITQRMQTEQVLRDTLRRAREQLAITSLISQSNALLSGDVESLAHEITELGAGAMGCERVNVWWFDESEADLTCIDLFEATAKRHSSGAVLHESEYGLEFRTLKAAKYVDANDPLTDPRTAGYIETYVKPIGITSMLDVAVQTSTRTFGLICFEHVGKPHIWEKDEIAFASQLADKFVLAITNKRRLSAEQALRSSERQLSNALAIARAGGWEFDPATNLFTFNDNFYRIFGTTAEEVGGYTMSPEEYARRFVHPDDLEVIGKAVAAALAATDPNYSREIEHRFLYANGETGCMAVRFFIIKDAEGHTTKSYGVNQDISVRKKMEQELALSNILRATTMESSLDGILVVDDHANIITYNRNFIRMFGVPQNLVNSGKDGPLLAYVATEVKDTERFLAKVKYYYEHRGEVSHDEIEIKDGRIFDRDTACLYDKGKYLGRVWFFRDITDRKRAEADLRDSQRFIEAILNTIPARVFWKDRNLNYLGCNSSFAIDAGLADPAEIVGKNDYELGWRVQADAYRADDVHVIESGCPKLLIEEPQTTLSGDTITLLTSKIPLRNSSGEIAGVLGMYLDITDRKRAEEALRESETNFRTIFTSVTEGIFLVDLATARILDANPAGCAIVGYSREEILGCDIGTLSSGVSPYTLEHALEVNARLVEEGPQTFEWHAKARDGHLLWLEVSVRCATLGGRQLVLAALRDITDRKQSEAVIMQMARYDALTGLANRRVFVEELKRAIARSRRREKGLAVLYLDLDHFKDVNDTLGHPVGDELLKAVAERLRANMRDIDTVARFGGDEFAVVMSDMAEPADAAMLAEKLLKCLAEPFHLGDNEIRSATSIGIATYGADSPDAEAMLTHADVALYRAKNEGRGTFRFFTDAMDREVKTRVALAGELRQAIDTEQFTLHYQPEVDIDKGQIIGLEALVRWNHPQRGLLGPCEFIPAAEKSGLIVPLGRWILRAACRQTREWIDLGIAPSFVAVNLSILQFKSTQDLEKDIAAAQAEFGLPPRMLELELTETVLMDATHHSSDVLERLRARGVRIAIDDFGTGYSSLEYLRRLSVDQIKIAQGFVADLDAEPSSGPIVKAALGLARELGLGVIAEGIETKAQLDLLRSWGCREAQGFYFAEPRPPQEITKLLRAGRILLPSPRLALSSPAEMGCAAAEPRRRRGS